MLRWYISSETDSVTIGRPIAILEKLPFSPKPLVDLYLSYCIIPP